MGREIKRCLVLGAILTAGVSAENGTLVAVHVYNYAQAPAATLGRAVKEAGRILGDAGIETGWVDCPITSAEMDKAPACREERLTNLTVRIIPQAAESLSPHMLGFALPHSQGAIHASVFYNRVRVLAEQLEAPEWQILGHAIAHEIGHLLLGEEKHSSGGLMKARWTRTDMQLAKVEQLRFNRQQGAAMRNEVERRAGAEAQVRLAAR